MARWKFTVPAAIAIICVAAVVFYLDYYRRVSIRTFSDCVGAGYAVSDTYPLQCTANGRTFVKQDSDPVREAIANVVADFGTAMQLVSPGAPPAEVVPAIMDNYRNLVAPALLASWVRDPASAPGRSSSGVWPDHIAIGSLDALSPTEYVVTGRVVLATGSGDAGGYAVTTTVEVVNGNWMITAWDPSQG